jgi:DnaJ-class molecular chaperone
VARDASLETIRKAYRKLAKRDHPDLNPGDAKAEARFKRLAAAHQLLSDPATRARFDRGEIDAEGQETPRPNYRQQADGPAGRRYGPAGAAQDGWDGEDIGDMFSSMFGDGRDPGRARRGPRRGQDQHFTLTAAFLDTINGATTRLTLPDGRMLDVKIPTGASDGDTLRLRGQGGTGEAGAGNGDALIELHVASHPFFRRDGADIRLDLPVTVAEAVLGGPVDIPTPGGTVRMRIPAGSDSLTQLRLRGRGVPAHGTTAAGDLTATLRVTIGPADPALVAFLKGWTPESQFNPRKAMEQGG